MTALFNQKLINSHKKFANQYNKKNFTIAYIKIMKYNR